MTKEPADRKTGDERLLKLADFLETVPPERFNYNSWVGITWEGDESLSCGTTACALGWATTIPEFRQEGLRLKSYVFDGRVFGNVGLSGEDANEVMAVERVFGIVEHEFDYLFVPWSDDEGRATAADVAKKIRDFVKDKHDFVRTGPFETECRCTDCYDADETEDPAW